MSLLIISHFHYQGPRLRNAFTKRLGGGTTDELLRVYHTDGGHGSWMGPVFIDSIVKGLRNRKRRNFLESRFVELHPEEGSIRLAIAELEDAGLMMKSDTGRGMLLRRIGLSAIKLKPPNMFALKWSSYFEVNRFVELWCSALMGDWIHVDKINLATGIEDRADECLRYWEEHLEACLQCPELAEAAEKEKSHLYNSRLAKLP